MAASHDRSGRARFVLCFGDEARAREAGIILDRRGFDVRVLSPEDDREQWSVHALKETGPVISRGFGLTELRLGWLARRLGGRYEGHHAQTRR